MSTHAYNPAASAIKELRIRTLVDEVPKTQIAREIGVNRSTVAKYLKADDMSLNMFLQIAKAADVDPIPILYNATHKEQNNPQPADG